MTDIATLLDTDPDTVDNFTQLREAYKGLQAKLKEIAPKAKQYDSLFPAYQEMVLKELGVEPGSPKATGIGKLHGDKPFTAEELRKTAEEHGYELGNGDPTADGTTATGATKPDLSPEEKAALESSERGAQVAGLGGSVEPQTAQQRYAEAETKGDLQGMLRAQNEIAHAARTASA